jgi:hypothetical protein
MNKSENEILTIGELCARYPHQWLGVEVVEREKDGGQPLKVRLISRHVELFHIREKIKGEFCSIFTGYIPEVMHVLMF